MGFSFPPEVEKALVQSALSKTGQFLQKTVSLAAAAGVTYLAKKIPGADQYIDTPFLVGVIWAVADTLLNAIPATIIKKYNTEIQTVLVSAGSNIKVDGLALSNTTAAVIATAEAPAVAPGVVQTALGK